MLPASAAAPLVSILVPSYNYARFLPQAIESILAQSHIDFELIISDDNSQDASDSVIRHYAALDPRIIYERHQKNLGMVANWNWCLNKARGKYIKFLFGDDCFASPEALSIFVNLLEQNPNASIAASARFTIGENCGIDGLWSELGNSGTYDRNFIITKCLLRSGNLIGEPTAVIFRRTLGTRGFDPAFRQIVDLEMWFHLLMQGDLAYTQEPACCFRRHSAQQTEINKQTHVGFTEMSRILRVYLPTVSKDHTTYQPTTFTKKIILLRTYLLLRKKNSKQPEIQEELDWLKAQLPFLWRLPCLLLYRTSRPMENLRRFLQKRRATKLLSKNSAAQIAFLNKIAEKTPVARV